jgi:hypothetical protein
VCRKEWVFRGVRGLWVGLPNKAKRNKRIPPATRSIWILNAIYMNFRPYCDTFEGDSECRSDDRSQFLLIEPAKFSPDQFALAVHYNREGQPSEFIPGTLG